LIYRAVAIADELICSLLQQDCTFLKQFGLGSPSWSWVPIIAYPNNRGRMPTEDKSNIKILKVNDEGEYEILKDLNKM
jgi:hypothetical protein